MINTPNAPSDGPGSLPWFHRRVAAYVVVGALCMMAFGVAASIALGMWWSAHLEPVSDGIQVLELQRTWQTTPDAD